MTGILRQSKLGHATGIQTRWNGVRLQFSRKIAPDKYKPCNSMEIDIDIRDSTNPHFAKPKLGAYQWVGSKSGFHVQ
eukprot:6459165-Amphidinium_carterae.1